MKTEEKNNLPKIKVIKCDAVGDEFSTAITNSIHQTLKTPSKYSHLKAGVWIMGLTEPIRLIPGEYEIIS